MAIIIHKVTIIHKVSIMEVVVSTFIIVNRILQVQTFFVSFCYNLNRKLNIKINYFKI